MTSSDSKVVLKNLIVQNNINQKKKKRQIIHTHGSGRVQSSIDLRQLHRVRGFQHPYSQYVTNSMTHFF